METTNCLAMMKYSDDIYTKDLDNNRYVDFKNVVRF
jgi:hypothetical protein